MSRAGCWPDPTPIDPCWAQATSQQKTQAADIAAAILWWGTGGQFSLCPVTIRPCVRNCFCACNSGAYASGVGWGWWSPYIGADGLWRNCMGCLDTCCGVQEVELPSKAYSGIEVFVDGVLLDPALYRLDNRRRLVRTDGQAWPHCQSMSSPLVTGSAGAGTFGIRYVQSRLDAAGLAAYATLAGQIVSSWVDQSSCRLPQGITSLSREGVTIDFAVLGDLASRTGLVEVDTWLRLVNPTGAQRVRSAVLSPDTLYRPRRRTTTWGV